MSVTVFVVFFFFFNFRGICGGDEDVMALIEPLISPLVRGYTGLYNKQKNLKKLQEGKKDEFFGLRDFYRYECVQLSDYFQVLKN